MKISSFVLSPFFGFILSALPITNGFSQTADVVRITGGKDPLKVLSYKSRYQFDTFTPGKVYHVKGNVSVARFNYNYLTNDIQFVNDTKDTLSILDRNLVKMVAIGDTLFYRDNTVGYVQAIGDYDLVTLGKKQVMVSIGADKSVGYGQYVTTASTDNATALISPNGQRTTLEKNTALIFSKKVSFYFIDSNRKFYPANRGSILKIFSRYRKQVLGYLDENDVNFQRESSLKNLMEFCKNLRTTVD